MVTKKKDDSVPKPMPVLPQTGTEIKLVSNDTVTMVFPTKVRIGLSDGTYLNFDDGIHEVPRELSNHWYLKANNVKIYERKG